MIWDLPPQPAIIRPAEAGLVKASFLPGWFPVAFAGAVAAPSVVAMGADEADATSFTLNPTALGAAVGDIMVVMTAWESAGATITPPAGWAENVDADGTGRRAGIHTIRFTGTVPGDQTWSYSAVFPLLALPGVAYAWAIIRGASAVESVSFDEGSIEASVGLDSFSVSLTGLRIAAVVGVCFDGNTASVAETATLSGVNQQANGGTSHLVGRYSMVGFCSSSATVSYTTTAFQRDFGGNYIVYLQ